MAYRPCARPVARIYMKVEIDRAARYYGSMRSKYWTRRTPERGDGVSLVLAMYRVGSSVRNCGWSSDDHLRSHRRYDDQLSSTSHRLSNVNHNIASLGRSLNFLIKASSSDQIIQRSNARRAYLKSWAHLMIHGRYLNAAPARLQKCSSELHQLYAQTA